MEITHNSQKRQFHLRNDRGEEVGNIGYMRGSGGELYATHTHVHPVHRGKGYAALLLDALAGYAEEQGDAIVPLCSYVADAFKKQPDKYAAVIKGGK